MKAMLFIYAVLLLGYAAASPAKTSTNASVKAKPCMTPCDDTYSPVCGGDGEAKPILFGSECVLKNYNCDNEKHFKTLAKSACPEGTSIRLS